MESARNKEIVAAYHEAGHAVGAFLLGVPFGDITLDATTEGQGSVVSPLTIRQIREANLSWNYAVVLMLGREAERIAFGRADRSYLQEDARHIAGLYLTFFATEMPGHRFRAELRSRTADIAGRPEFREAVEALASIVLAEKTVPGSRAAATIQSSISNHNNT